MADVHAAYHKIAYEMLTRRWNPRRRGRAARERGDPDAAAKGGEGSRVGVRQVRGDHRRARRGAPQTCAVVLPPEPGHMSAKVAAGDGGRRASRAMVAAFRAYVDGARRFPEVRREDGFDAISDIVRAADEGRREGV